MTPSILVLVLVSVSMSSAAQIFLKYGMASPSMQSALQQGGIAICMAVLTNLHILGGLTLYALGAVVWLGVLARIDVSIAYPFVALGFILTMILAALTLGETIGTLRIAGTILIAAGAVLVTRS
ncbi:DMT family transporter [Noviherbaspirillum autotrophicum]|uniref:Small multi-drug resistant family protein n=1 Tax=Noviherbaspirillum autotrophicum TaxID=709839 RepID=A0A0C2BQZ0_9BURK|nr:hypothetical protein [Noviherbaspirillum autotrophicum]KIF83715.1 hypothetical protein TSA66_13120 [Noviherbaspirillum autotrophicum]